MKNNKWVVSWSINQEHLYLDDDTDDERLVDICFVNDTAKIPKSEKIKIIKAMISE